MDQWVNGVRILWIWGLPGIANHKGYLGWGVLYQTQGPLIPYFANIGSGFVGINHTVEFLVLLTKQNMIFYQPN